MTRASVPQELFLGQKAGSGRTMNAGSDQTDNMQLVIHGHSSNSVSALRIVGKMLASLAVQSAALFFENLKESCNTLFMAGVISNPSTSTSLIHMCSECSSGFNRMSIGSPTVTT